MALRSVVLESPANPGAPRRTVVLRPGGPAPKGRAVDLLACILGVLLLVGAIALVQVLPDTDYVNPRYKLTFPTGGGESGTLEFEFLESTANTNVFSIDIPNDNVVVVKVSASFRDDRESSKPDAFRVRLYDPLGNEVGQPELLENPKPRQNNTTFDSFFAIGVWTNAVGPLPQEAIVEAATHKETQREALDRLEPQFHLPGKGTWTVKVELLEAGDCPSPTDPDADQAQVAVCSGGIGAASPGVPDTADPGNKFTLENVAWTYFVTCTETMEQRDPKPLPSCK